MFDTTPDISRHSLVSMVPWEIAKKYKPKAEQETQTVKYCPAKIAYETPELISSQGSYTTTRFLMTCRGTSEPTT